MALIVLNVFPHPSHFEDTFVLANRLRELGHDVRYASDQVGYREVVISKGFSFYLIEHKKKFTHPVNVIFKFIQLFANLNAIDEYVDTFEYLKSVRHAASNPALFNRMIEELSPDLILIDHDLPFNALQLTRYNVPCALFETRPPREMPDAVFPWEYQSSLTRIAKTYKVKLLWTTYHLARSCRRIIHWLQGLGTEQYYLAREVRYKWKDQRMEIDASGNFYFRAKGIPELILYPWDIILPKALGSHQICVGPLHLEERDNTCDYIFLQKLKDLKQAKFKATTPLVFCLINPRIKSHISVCKKFGQRLIDSFHNLSYQLIVAVGDDIDPGSFVNTSPNIHVLQTVPSHEILKNAALMINHGDMQSLTECIVNEVPCLVYPLPSNWEHTGNSTCAVFHGVGLRGNILKENKNEIQRKITQILSSADYKRNTIRLKEKILERTKKGPGIDIIRKLISSKSSVAN